MIINRHNYEEFFLLYVDNELEADARAAVESFVSQNPDLAKELEMLQQATLDGDNILFGQKELLYKIENSISIDNYEEYFLLFADNELNEQQAIEVEDFVLKHPELQNQFTFLQKTKLQPEIIAFPGKENLYRKEKKVRRIIPVTFMRIGAAAAIIGIAYISFVVTHPVNRIGKNEVAVSQKPVTKTSASERNDADTAQKSVTETQVASLNDVGESKSKVKNIAINIRRKRNEDKVKVVVKNREEQVAVDLVKPKSKLQIAKQPVANEEAVAKKPDVAEAPMEKNNLNDKDNSNSLTGDEKNTLAINEPIVNEDKPLVTHAVYLETDNIEEEKNLYIGSAEINKNKVKGLFKKAAVFFEKKIRHNEE